MMTLKETTDSASALGNQIRAGIPLAMATARLGMLQPSYSEYWQGVSTSLQNGQSLSISLAEIWPEELVSAVKAGEHSGDLEEVFSQIQETISIRLEILGRIKDLVYPVTMTLGGIGVFVWFMVFVIPSTTGALSGTGKDGLSTAITSLSVWMQEVIKNYWIVLACGIVAGSVSVYRWLQTEGARRMLLNYAIGIPVVGPSLGYMYFGLWCKYMAMMNRAGIGTLEALLISARVLPDRLQAGVLAFHHDLAVKNRPMHDAAEAKNWEQDDPRHEWPFYVSHAFMVAETSGEIDKELLRVAPSLIKDGVILMTRAIAAVKFLSIALAGAMLGTSAFVYYVPILSAMKYSGH